MGFPVLDGYKIKNEFASGGMAKIYDAIQVSLNRPVAIKFLSKKLLSHDEAKSLFERESLIIAQLNHPNIVQVIDKGISEESQPYFVMEKLKGIDLSQMLSQGELPYSKKMDIAIQLCKGLAYAHKNGVIHRDIKPSNIIIDQHANVKILDFGIALADDEKRAAQTSVMGTQGYVAPEQEDDYSKATFASDIYSVGILFYDLFGKPESKQNKTQTERLGKDISPDLRTLIEKCCHKNPSERYQSLNEVRDELLRISQGSHLGKTNIKEAETENKDLTQNFNLLDVLSKSPNKRVYLFQKKSNRQLLVIKRMMGEFSGFKEAKLLSSLKHPNIVNILAAAKSNNNATLITEYLSGGSLKTQLIQDMSEQSFLVQACQICSAIYFAHQNKILHSNLSPNNILFDAKQNLKVCDFGQINTNDDPESMKAYQPPGQQAHSEQYDIYSMAAVFHEMLYSVPPGYPRPTPAKKISFRLEKLIDGMLSLDPINRPSSAQQVLVELQRIANLASNKKLRSKMGEGKEEKAISMSGKKRVKQKQSSYSVLWLSVALAVSVMINIALLLRDFMR